MRPKEDPTSIGSILMKMGFANKEQILKAAEQQEQMNYDVLLGKLLVANEIINKEQLKKALDAQDKLRNKNKFNQAIAVANLAIFKKRSHKVTDEIIRVGNHVAEKVSSSEYPIITQKMMSAAKD